MRAFAGAVAVLALVAGCSAKRAETPTFDPTSTPVSTPPTKPSGSPPGSVKYTTEKLKSCLEIRQQVGAELPASQPDDDQRLGSDSSARTCTFRAGEQSIVFNVRSWENTDNAAGVTSGPDHAKKYFGDRTASWEQDSGVNIGSDARWRAAQASACALEVLDENAVLTIMRSGTEGEQCRASVRELAKKFYAAVQP
ncbi:hypothetical protein [Lentzea albidocapillata]|uniref:DUF3558 domain-containing protein n=1 Tax=Lentzea albidocapillata TaxID=40571 RepID=A0A1W2EFN9_9PSEU|nr:hypothetical protein [Lentzea albidocapillata]SMD08475.1 hypothetical protein SAMN05660733_04024 [Lentzea albidocapillata]